MCRLHARRLPSIEQYVQTELNASSVSVKHAVYKVNLSFS